MCVLGPRGVFRTFWQRLCTQIRAALKDLAAQEPCTPTTKLNLFQELLHRGTTKQKDRRAPLGLRKPPTRNQAWTPLSENSRPCIKTWRLLRGLVGAWDPAMPHIGKLALSPCKKGAFEVAWRQVAELRNVRPNTPSIALLTPEA